MSIIGGLDFVKIFICLVMVFFCITIPSIFSVASHEGTGRSQVETEQGLQKLGFKRVGNSNLFKKCGFLLSVGQDGQIVYYLEHKISEYPIKGITVGQEFKPQASFGYLIQKENGFKTYHEISLDHSSSVLGKMRESEASRFQGKLDEQLIRSGFKKDSLNPEVFKFENKDSTIMGVIDSGAVRFWVPMKERNQAMIRGAHLLFENSSANGLGSEDGCVLDFADQISRFSMPDWDTKSRHHVRIVEDLLSVDPVKIGYKAFTAVKDKSSLMLIGGMNSSSILEKLTSINGIPIAKLENDMRPGELSSEGFLRQDDKLLDVLKKDNETVLGRYHLSHQELARPLNYLRALGDKGMAPEEFVYNGQHFRIKYQHTHSSQESPFHDGTRSGANATITNMDSGESIEFAYLVGDLIERYGFYEEGPYRMDPEKIIRIFGLTKKN
jgi:hypothetical protein